MYERLKRLYDDGKLDDNGLDNAVAKGWISPQEAETIRTQRDDEPAT